VNERLTTWKARIIEIGLFILFVVGFTTFVIYEVKALIGPLFNK